ncbi:pseudoazurin [Sphingomonas vulcanisoli]|uniref:Pseudoazurin n=1 Tax=Sphingomonas vulcanisoli TaxID=1658060 RepID=A0ABX0TSV8_9SPHN|nr:pseudoazurin [Sphingomonas vulcanisoli]NIJ08602.1 pseudoazurin [Sphingomonas vulcanisoli]
MIKPAAVFIAIGLAAAPAMAKDITVQMKNFGSDHTVMVFEPAYVAAAVGDKVHFVPTDMGHNAEPIDGMLPAGVAAPKGQVNKEYVLTLTKPGLYGIKCLPHFSMGMIALVKAGKGKAPNAAAAAAAPLPALATKRMAPLLAMAAK